MLTKDRIWEVLVSEGLVRFDTHVVLGSGPHTREYFNAAPALIPHAILIELIEHMHASIVQQGFGSYKNRELAIIGIGCGSIYATLIGQRLGGIPVVYAEKCPTRALTINRGQEAALKGRKVIIIDDVHTTGATIRNLMDITVETGGIPALAMVILDRHKLRTREMKAGSVTIPFHSLFHKHMETFASREACPACQQKIPFLEKHGAGSTEYFIRGQPGS